MLSIVKRESGKPKDGVCTDGALMWHFRPERSAYSALSNTVPPRNPLAVFLSSKPKGGVCPDGAMGCPSQK